jgi:N-acylneuraminate cytidylyltransferase
VTAPAIGEVVAIVPVRAQDYERANVTTSVEAIRVDAMALGAEAPFVRPESLVGAGVSLALVLQHALDWLDREESYRPNVCVSLEIAHPLRPPQIIDQVIEALVAEDLDTVFAAAEERSPFWRIDDDGAFREVASGATRATRPPLYRQLSGLASASKPDVIRRGRSIGDRVGVVPVRDLSALVDVQDEHGLALLRRMLTHHEL